MPNAAGPAPRTPRRVVRSATGIDGNTASTRHGSHTPTTPRPSTQTSRAIHRQPTRNPAICARPTPPTPSPVVELCGDPGTGRHQDLPSLTTDTLRLVLDDETTTALFIDVCQQLAEARIPATIARAIGLGRLVAFQKPNGGVRGLVIGDVLRRVVSRCIAQLFAGPIHTACSPHQFALSTRSGTGAVIHAHTTATGHDDRNAILSIAGIGAYDNISRSSMLEGLHRTPPTNRCLPFVRLWYTTESEYVWHDANGQHHSVTQAEGWNRAIH